MTTRYVAHLWNEKRTKLLQSFGPYTYESDAEAAIERFKKWAFQDGAWEVAPLYGDPQVEAWANPVYPRPSITWTIPAWTGQIAPNATVIYPNGLANWQITS
jgi:hypothetical protein